MASDMRLPRERVVRVNSDYTEGARLVCDSSDIVKSPVLPWDRSIESHEVRSYRTIGGKPASVWSERLCLMREIRDDLASDSATTHLSGDINRCIDGISRLLGTTVLRNSPKRVFEKTPPSTVPVDNGITYEDQVLPGNESYTMDNLVESLDTIDVGKDESDEIPLSLRMEAHAAEAYFGASIVQRIYSRRWQSRIDAIDELTAMVESDELLSYNDGVFHRAIMGLTMCLSRLFQDHALKVLIKSLDLLDAFFGFMERHQSGLSTARGGSNSSIDSSRSSVITCCSQFLDVIISRLGDRVSAVVDCAICALMKVAESASIPTYEDVSRCLIRSLGVANNQPGVRSICNRLRLLSTLLLRSPQYTSHGTPRYSLKPVLFFETLGALSHHSHGLVRAAALDAISIGLKVCFSGITVPVDPSIRNAADRIDLSSISVLEGDASARYDALLAEAQSIWSTDIFQRCTPRQ
ncbi:hypothetical protein BBOV_I002130 [Babesia bovis T2Bo]|uniref:TOG domain-containing protein n=1 Tax=Babesia bovis TaxID=5865 RepID=A7AW68_BABBO|nr:hypothetical protein BBOV_I002130 [Babesia bovis T2Bo]EDO05296.1 hypothetical protein BBOV_I002130 [Babesia bovis T2Bo]|eukprot:XP_001608864.1 hypothetical protein [Babesia bovis T2Bo]